MHWEPGARDGMARTGTLRTGHGVVRTPAFMPVGTLATVKGLTPRDLQELGVEIVLANGGRLQAEVIERPLGPSVPLNVYWAKLGPEHGLRLLRNANGQLMTCSDGLVETVVARDSEGRVLGRRVPAWNGNPTGDPDGQRPPQATEDTCV